jgi:hypothetical protein
MIVGISHRHPTRRAQHRDAAWIIKLAVATALGACAGEDANEGAVKPEL